ncbi:MULTISPECIES: thioesterase II family protein [Paenibacillus]|uniref:Thioesterase n=1 Tax=Paenibacillus cucumis (ex Kampfer et al. 2016) TaxID=1776858 RepID=A0ABS7KG41_9BACL|nr:alpha/beta fold hydrolase [Paenibacillus cucumis (ex Kampfer et al. 2016)]MBY0203100.1 thioesterase [Paenibacillus cucumis (ex Kampfer et al. 2016)]MDP9700490.1 surfactin synthase thioesterase subunit [Paenibacillus intestini]
MKLFCLPCAGGSSHSLYANWVHEFKSFHVIPVELPGRGSRFNETLLLTIEEMAKEVEKKIQDNLKPGEHFAIFGHSMGGLLAYELGLRFKDSLYILSHIFLSAYKPPHFVREENCHEFSDERLVEYIIKLGGTPDHFFDNEEVRKLFLPIFRADFTAVETYVSSAEPKRLSMDVTILAGKDDKISLEELKCWEIYSNNPIKIHIFEGGHFYLNDQRECLYNILCQSLKYNHENFR